ncbi:MULTISPECIES: aminotransferase class I/II-fold pyridoxal phosphate-dependent enzyme [unclassified Moraxella]|uniref:aminotransferase class I/II-fold pyridoxal phosphate-dependent enzyme n=1 Tax=unclassified Moraxella TaxID=2685852 RepID=UPI003AF9D024
MNSQPSIAPTANKDVVERGNEAFIEQGQRLTQLRKAKGFTTEQLATLMTQAGAKVSRGAISNWERGNNGIVSTKLPVLARLLDCSESYLLSGDIATSNSIPPMPESIGLTTTDNATDLAITPTTTGPHFSVNQTGSPMNALNKSDKLQNVCYDIRGPLLQTANRMEAQGHKILKLNIGNPAPFGLEAPQEILSDVAVNLPNAIGYSDSQGIFAARKAILQYYQAKGLLEAVDVSDVYVGNGVSELIVMTMQAMLNDGDEVLIPMPDYPLWTAATNLAGGKAVHYLCNEADNWQPDIADIEAKITPNTKGIVVINPNNPTGALYSTDNLKKIVALAEKHNLVLMADEIYDRVLYDDAVHIPLCTLAKNCLVLSYNGLSKSHRIAGFRSGWLMISGKKDHASDFIEGLQMLSSMRLCANVPAQYAIQTAMGGYQSMQALTAPTGRLYKQREIAIERLNAIKGISCTMPQGAFYCFPKIDREVYPIEDDMAFMMELLQAEKVLMVQGTGFNWHAPDHFRVVFLPNAFELNEAMDRLDRFFAKKRQEFGTD